MRVTDWGTDSRGEGYRLTAGVRVTDWGTDSRGEGYRLGY